MNPNVIEEVKRQASYRWKEMFLALAPQLQPAIEKAGRHVPCPVPYSAFFTGSLF